MMKASTSVLRITCARPPTFWSLLVFASVLIILIINTKIEPQSKYNPHNLARANYKFLTGDAYGQQRQKIWQQVLIYVQSNHASCSLCFDFLINNNNKLVQQQ